MPLAGGHVLVGKEVGPLDRERRSAATAERVRATGHLLQPGGHVELRITLSHACSHAPDPESEQHEHDQHSEHDREREQEGVIGREHDQADERHHDDADSLHEQRRDRLLTRGNLEEPVDDVGPVGPVEGGDAGAGQTIGKPERRADKQPPLQALGHVGLHRPQHGRHEQQREHHRRQHENRPEQDPESHGINERLDGRRRDQRQQADAQGEGQERVHIRPLQPHQIDESLAGALAMRMASGMARGMARGRRIVVRRLGDGGHHAASSGGVVPAVCFRLQSMGRGSEGMGG